MTCKDIVYHQSFDDGYFLRICADYTNIPARNRHHRIKDRNCVDCNVDNYCIVPFISWIYLDNFNRYHVYLLFLALFCLPFLGFAFITEFELLLLIRLYMGLVYSVCGSATMTLAGDALPQKKVRQGISRFALTISIGMAAGPFVGIQVQHHMSSQVSFLVLFVLTVIALICVSCSKIRYPKVKRKNSLSQMHFINLHFHLCST